MIRFLFFSFIGVALSLWKWPCEWGSKATIERLLISRGGFISLWWWCDLFPLWVSIRVVLSSPSGFIHFALGVDSSQLVIASATSTWRWLPMGLLYKLSFLDSYSPGLHIHSPAPCHNHHHWLPCPHSWEVLESCWLLLGSQLCNVFVVVASFFFLLPTTTGSVEHCTFGDGLLLILIVGVGRALRCWYAIVVVFFFLCASTLANLPIARVRALVGLCGWWLFWF